jgi:hypothetical protein
VARIDAALRAGTIDFDTAARQTLYFLFEAERVDQEFRVPSDLPEKGATRLLHELELRAGELSPATRALLASYVDRGDPRQLALLAFSHDTPAGHFRITYQTSGPDAVPPADVDPANGVPDFVERVGEYAETAWTIEIDTLGYPAPPIESGPYSIALVDLGAGLYGYTTPVGGQLTRIVMDNDYVGFPPNTDPDGNALGAAKVTVAHELKHGSQYVGSGWSEGDWVEVDATWMEDVVFDQTNDYYNYLFASQIRSPFTAIAPGSYEDCIWQHYQSEKFGLSFVFDVWNRRDIGPQEPMLTTYGTIFRDYGSTLADGFGEFLTYAYQCGDRANVDNPGFEEARDYPSPSTSPAHAVYPVTGGPITVTGMAGRFVGFVNLPGSSEALRLSFDGQDGVASFRVNVIWAREEGDVLAYELQPMTLDPQADGEVITPPVESLAFVTLVVTNGAPSGSASFTYAAEFIGAAAIAGRSDAPPRSAALIGAAPNPLNPSTTIRYELSERELVTLAVYSAQGRLVRILAAETEEAGEHSVAWDGRDLIGRPVASGTYVLRLAIPGYAEARKLTVVK